MYLIGIGLLLQAQVLRDAQTKHNTAMIIRISKIGKVDNPIAESNFGDSQEFFQGETESVPTVGDCFSLNPSSESPTGIMTTRVMKVTDTTFETRNSVYSWEIISK